MIPCREVLHDLPEEKKRCEGDGTPLERIGEEVCEQLEFIPATLRVLRHVRPKYACPRLPHRDPGGGASRPSRFRRPALLALP